MKIAVLDDYQDAFRSCASYSRLADHEITVFRDTEKDASKHAQRLAPFDAIVLTQQRSQLRRAVIERLPRLRLVAQTGGHTGHLDIDACTEHGIVISSGPNNVSHSTIELTWALILASLRRLPQEVENMKRGAWQAASIGCEMHGLRLGVYGLGKIGSQVAQIGVAFGMQVSCWGREATLAKARAAGYEVPASRASFFEQADVLSLHVRYGEQTRGIVSAADLARMKPNALLVNTGRAGLIEDGALVAALKRGRPGYAAVDVYEDEPVTGGDHPLLTLSNAICTPHLGYAVAKGFEFHYKHVVDNLLAYAAGNPANVLNPAALASRSASSR